MDKDIPRINCTTITTWRNTKTGEIFKEARAGKDIVEDVTVQVSPKGMEVLQKVLNQKNDKPKS
tara:strand:+ start:386 stop:577 length:192 start_codon:yes stop_codon:yes gene_type:complete